MLKNFENNFFAETFMTVGIDFMLLKNLFFKFLVKLFLPNPSGWARFFGQMFFKMDGIFWILFLEILVHRKVVEKMGILGY